METYQWQIVTIVGALLGVVLGFLLDARVIANLNFILPSKYSLKLIITFKPKYSNGAI